MAEQRTNAQPVATVAGEAEAAKVSQALADAAAEAAEHPRGETVPGGRYVIEGQLVNAEGEPLKGKG